MAWRTETKLFVTFFLLYSLFATWPGMNENSRLFITKAIVDENRFEIDTFYNQTGDRALFNGHYYSDKEPGTSLLAILPYFLWKSAYTAMFGAPTEDVQYDMQKANNVTVFVAINPGAFSLVSMILVTILTASLFVSLSVVLLYKISAIFTEKEGERLLATAIYGLGSLIFHYGLVFLNHGISAFLAALAFYLLLKTGEGKEKRALLSGICAGIAGMVEVSIVLIAILLFLYALSRLPRQHCLLFALGCVAGISPFLIYNTLLFSGPFDLPRYHLDPAVWPALPGNNGIIINPLYNAHVVLRLLFFPYKGLFFYFPVLLLFIPGLLHMERKFRSEKYLIIAIFLSILFAASTWWAWWHGAVFGPRFLAVLMPFMLIPIMFAVKSLDKKVVAILLVVSMLNNFAGLQANYEDMLKDPETSLLLPDYQSRFDRFQPMENPLFSYYYPLLAKNGPRSRVLESAIGLRIPDIRGIHGIGENFSFQYGIGLIALLGILWGKETVYRVAGSIRKKLTILRHQYQTVQAR